MAQFALTRDINGYVAYGLAFNSSNNSQFKLSANSAVTLTVPTDYNIYEVVFQFEPGTKVWVSNSSDTINPPSSSTPTSTTAQLNPTVREVAQGSTLQFITSDTSSEVGVSFYGKNS